jgi:hypothetical protein
MRFITLFFGEKNHNMISGRRQYDAIATVEWSGRFSSISRLVNFKAGEGFPVGARCAQPTPKKLLKCL